jgi:hypothetical protein
MNTLKAILQWFDIYGQPIAPLNMKGLTKFTTTLGGVVGMAVIALSLWFLQTRLNKMINLDDAIMSEVT